MKAVDLRIKTNDELKDQLVDLKREALNLRFQKASGQLEGTARVREVRRDIARTLSVMNEKSRKTAGQE